MVEEVEEDPEEAEARDPLLMIECFIFYLELSSFLLSLSIVVEYFQESTSMGALFT